MTIQVCTISSIPDLWKRTLASVQGYFPKAIIAGGALRDLTHDKPVKDVDIFVPITGEIPTQLFAEQIHAIAPNAGIICASMYGQSGKEATPGFRNIYVIWSVEIEGTTFEIIFIEDRGENLISVFDLSLAQIGFDGNWVQVTMDFLDTLESKVVKVCNINRSDRQAKRMARLLEKYPEYTAEA